MNSSLQTRLPPLVLLELEELEELLLEEELEDELLDEELEDELELLEELELEDELLELDEELAELEELELLELEELLLDDELEDEPPPGPPSPEQAGSVKLPSCVPCMPKPVLWPGCSACQLQQLRAVKVLAAMPVPGDSCTFQAL